MSPLSTVRRVIGWAVLTAVVTSALVLGGITLVDRYVQAPRSNRIERAVHQSEANGRAIEQQTQRACDFYVATADALASLASSPDLTVRQRDAIATMQRVAHQCSDP